MARSDDTGIVLHDKLPVPKGRESEPRMAKRPSHPGGAAGSTGGGRKVLYAILGAAVLGGLAVGYFLRPMVSPDPRVAATAGERDAANQVAQAQQERADQAEKRLELAKATQTELQARLTDAEHTRDELAIRVAGVERQAQDVEGDKAKIGKALERGTATLTVQGDAIHVLLSDDLLFRAGDDQLTPRGKQVMSKLAFALKADVPDRLVWVQSHTDDQPVVVAPARKPPAKGAPPPAPPRFATNWELSAARALEVVHYLQDTAKLEPTRLAALAFGQYQPVSKTSKALNRRIELVLAPDPKAPVAKAAAVVPAPPVTKPATVTKPAAPVTKPATVTKPAATTKPAAKPATKPATKPAPTRKRP